MYNALMLYAHDDSQSSGQGTLYIQLCNHLYAQMATDRQALPKADDVLTQAGRTLAQLVAY